MLWNDDCSSLKRIVIQLRSRMLFFLSSFQKFSVKTFRHTKTRRNHPNDFEFLVATKKNRAFLRRTQCVLHTQRFNAHVFAENSIGRLPTSLASTRVYPESIYWIWIELLAVHTSKIQIFREVQAFTDVNAALYVFKQKFSRSSNRSKLSLSINLLAWLVGSIEFYRV